MKTLGPETPGTAVPLDAQLSQLPVSSHLTAGQGFRVALLGVSLAVLAPLVGCGVVQNVGAPVVSEAAISGKLHGGQQPVAGALVQLIAPGTTGYGVAGSVITFTTSGPDGSFTLPRPYTCPTDSGLVYILATGGDAGAGLNTAIAEAAIVGRCSDLTASTFVNISEVTTVAAAYALAPFATVTGTATIGTSATNLQGLYNAAGPANNLASVASGFAHATGDFPGIVLPTAEINTLADILAACINQGTVNVATGTCATLFTAATPPLGTAPADTFAAAIDIALHPGNHTATLFGLVTAAAPFQPTLPTTPADFSVALGFNGGGITLGGGTIGVAIDAAGNAWITTGVANANVHSLTEISPAGVYLSGATVAASTGFDSSVLSGPIGLSIDQSGAIYVANNGQNNVLKFNSDASLNSTITAASLSGPNGIATDANGNVWVANFTSTINRVTEITKAGTEATQSPFATGNGGVDIAAGPLAIWETDYASNEVSRIDLSSFAVNNINIGGSSGGIAIDHANNAWVAVTGNGNVYEISNTGAILSPFGGFVYPNGSVQNITVDGLGNIFAGGYLSDTSMGGLVEFSNSGVLLSPDNGFYGSNVIPVTPQPAEGIHIDGSGNVWIAGSNGGTALPNYVAEVIGIAAPVVTPRSVAVTNNTLGTRP